MQIHRILLVSTAATQAWSSHKRTVQHQALMEKGTLCFAGSWSFFRPCHEQTKCTNSLMGFTPLPLAAFAMLTCRAHLSGYRQFATFSPLGLLNAPPWLPLSTAGRQPASSHSWLCFPHGMGRIPTVLRKALIFLYCSIYLFYNMEWSCMKWLSQHVAGLPADLGWTKGHQSCKEPTLSSGSSTDIQQVES